MEADLIEAVVLLPEIVTKEDAACNDFNLSPSRYVATGEREEILPLEEAVVLHREADEERTEADRELARVLRTLGLGDFRAEG